ncbi:Helicase-related protein [Pseudoalteromonas luteoviolacea B = ATCC 29581]|nr:Helicase-related protein [Pseudoalteromonas luteoviolacea B = ATCC 29581]
MYTLRSYQQDAVEHTLNHFRKTSAPAVIVLPTGAGKSLVIAELARLAKHKILVLAHVKELVDQNAQKYKSFGLHASIFSAGLGEKSVSEQVTFASVQSLARNKSALNEYYSLVIIDECHRIGEDENGQYHQILQQLKIYNPNLKVLGLTATPYRLTSGWIYHRHYHGFVRGGENAFFTKCIYELPLSYMIKSGYLTVPKQINPAIEHYDFSSLVSSVYGEYAPADLNRLLDQQTRATHSIIQDILKLSKQRKGIMIFASTVEHAKEIHSYLEQEQVGLITGDTPKTERDRLIAAFKAQQLKYLVNVSVLTTGFDAPHVDVIAILRPTESVSLYQQIVGRGLRLFEGKQDCLVIDYAGNRFDIFYPEVGEKKPLPDSEPVQVLCPGCGFANLFWGKTDLQGNIIEHYGRRCQGLLEDDDESMQCDYRFRFKTCGQCGAENDIAARRCHSCDQVLVDPDDKLREALNLKNAMVIRCQGLSIEPMSPTSFKVIYHDEEGSELSEKYDFNRTASKQQFHREFLKRFKDKVAHGSLDTVAQIVQHQYSLSAPDFVIAHKHKKFGWQVSDKLFDYEGQFRRANEL